MLTALIVAFVIQGLGWAWVGAGLRRVREEAIDLEDGDGRGAEGRDLEDDTQPPPPDRPSLRSADGQAVPLSRGAQLSEPGAEEPARKRGATADLDDGLPITVVVAAHNEAERLPALLDALEAQTHHPFEVVIVDDRSTDRTGAVADFRAARFPVPLRVVRVEDADLEAAGLPPKKHALECGVGAARHDRLAFTDADGRPDPEWLATLARWSALEDESSLEDGGAVLIGYGPYIREPGLLNRFVRYETVTTAALAAASVGWNRPWHAVGRNLSYP
ncbi:glycosyltransferase, partial [Rubrivirga sp.]|uniref:glycosyltransferase n=1 Tax=Rubrivirga sp. TaxID=1885344 RepID=UPI003C78337B